MRISHGLGQSQVNQEMEVLSARLRGGEPDHFIDPEVSFPGQDFPEEETEGIFFEELVEFPFLSGGKSRRKEKVLGRIPPKRIQPSSPEGPHKFEESLSLLFLERKDFLLKFPDFFLQAPQEMDNLFLTHGKKCKRKCITTQPPSEKGVSG